MLEFLNDSLILCEKNSDKLVSDDIKWPLFFPNGKYKKYILKKVPDYDFFINHAIKNEIIQLQKYFIIIKFFVTKEIQNYNKKLLGNVHENFETKPNFANDLPLNFLIEYIKINKGFVKNKKIFDKTFEKFFTFFENILEDEYVSPLFNFESNINEKGITINDVGIRKINDSEFYTFTNLDDNSNLSSIFHNLTHVMFTKYSSDNLNSGYDIVKHKFQILLDSLSVFTVGNPQFGTIFRNINNPWMHYDSSYEKEVVKQKSLHFKKEELRKIKSISDSLSAIDFSKKENKFLEIAIRRFGSTLSRTNEIDQLIDLMISIESLYVSSPGEITVRLSNRLSTLLAKNDKQREDYWLFTKKVYSLRSGIIHGEGLRSTEINGKKYSLDEILDKLVDLTRKSILIYLKLVNHYSGKKKIDKICEDIDKALINKTYLKQLQSKFR